MLREEDVAAGDVARAYQDSLCDRGESTYFGLATTFTKQDNTFTSIQLHLRSFHA